MYKILKKEELVENIFSMTIYAPLVAKAAKPGQFVIVIAKEKSERIPLTIADYDINLGTVTIVVQIIGDSTKELFTLNENEYIKDFVGPLGNPSDFLEMTDEELKNEKILFVAGGLGAAPVYPQVKWLKEKNIDVDVIIGTKAKKTLIYENEMKSVAKNLFVVTDDGTYGRKGLVTDEIKFLINNLNKKYNKVVAIGPMIMMKFVSILTKELGIKTVVSLNPIMVDGTGMCGACRVTVANSVKFACVDGPEFYADEIDFDEALRKQNFYRTNSENNCCSHKIEENIIEDKNFKENFDRKKRVKDRLQKPEIRSENFEEVSLGYTKEMAMLEATRCLNCKSPRCVVKCPVNIKIPQFLMQVKDGNFEEAAKIILESNSLPSVCGRVCPQENQCEGSCIVGIKNEPVAIGRIERFVGDYVRKNNIKFENNIINNGKKVAIVGSGPSGLACAGDLAKMGYDVTIFEALHKVGGVLVYGIPEFRLPKKEVVDFEIENIKNLGVKIETDVIIGKTIEIDDLLNEYNFQAVYLATGAGLPNFMKIKGETANGVYSANEFLTRTNLMNAYKDDYKTPLKVGKKVAVVGAGNVAMDAARTALRLGAEVFVIYRRSEEEAPARYEEIEHAKEEGINFMFLTNPTEIISDENFNVSKIRCIKMKLGEPDASGRKSPIEIENSEFDLDINTVIMSIGTSPNPIIYKHNKDIERNRRGCIVADERGKTSKEKVFAGGDIVSGAATVILAMGAGKKAALAIDEMIKNQEQK